MLKWWNNRLDDLGESLLIYEGLVLLARRLHIDKASSLPLISEVVWRYPLSGTIVLLWLAAHFWNDELIALLRLVREEDPFGVEID